MSENAFMPSRMVAPDAYDGSSRPYQVAAPVIPTEDAVDMTGRGGTPPDFLAQPQAMPYGSAIFDHPLVPAEYPMLDGTEAAMSAAGGDYTGIDMLGNHSVTIIRG